MNVAYGMGLLGVLMLLVALALDPSGFWAWWAKAGRVVQAFCREFSRRWRLANSGVDREHTVHVRSSHDIPD